MESAELLSEAELAARAETWKLGLAHHWAIDEGQRKWLREFMAAPALSSTVWLIGRQRGKTFAAVFLALLTGITKKNAIIRYCAKTKDSARSIVMPAWKLLTETMPEELRPVKGANEYEYTFPSTGAVFVLFGTDSQSFSKGRGPRTDLQLLDECGFFQDLVSVESALFPSVQTTGGKILYLCTPPLSLAHPYNERVKAARASGLFQHDTFYSNPRVDHDAVIREEAKRLGMTEAEFLKSSYFRREFLAEMVQEDSRAGFPGFTDILQKTAVVDRPLPKFYDAYTSIDTGKVGDPHFALFGIHDWEKDILYVVDELMLPSGVTTLKQLSEKVAERELALWGKDRWAGTLSGLQDWQKELGNLPEHLKALSRAPVDTQPFIRVTDPASDADKSLTVDYQLVTLPAQKRDKVLASDALNSALVNGKVLIHPRCRNTISHVSGASWDKDKEKWIRGAGHHFEGVDCLLYMWRSIRWSRKAKLPQPIDRFREHMKDPQTDTSNTNLKNVFGRGVLS